MKYSFTYFENDCRVEFKTNSLSAYLDFLADWFCDRVETLLKNVYFI
jgi:hypothetical protein